MDNALVAPENRHVIEKYNMRINPGMKPKEPTYQVALDALALTTCYPTFLVTTEVLIIYMHQFWAIVTKHKTSYRFKTDNKKFSVNVEVHSGEIKYITDVIIDNLHQPWRTFASIINKCLCGKELAYQIDNIDSKKQEKMFYPRFIKIIIHCFLEKDKSISMRNRTFMHTARDDSLLGTMRFVSKHTYTQVYGAIIPKEMSNQALLDFVAYKTYYAIASGAEPPKSRKSQKKSDSAISSKESPSKKKYTKDKKVAATKSKPTKKKAPVKADRGKGDETNYESGVLDEQHRKTSSTNEGTGTKSGVPDVPKYDSESEKESWVDSGEEDDDENDSEDEDDDDDGKDDDGNDGNDGDGDDDDANDDDNQ
ncbi:hypothetical protein Tco_1270806 [Tanacetum coccineum]